MTIITTHTCTPCDSFTQGVCDTWTHAPSLFLHFEHIHSFHLNHHYRPIHHIIRSLALCNTTIRCCGIVRFSLAQPFTSRACAILIPTIALVKALQPFFLSRSRLPSLGPIRTSTLATPLSTCMHAIWWSCISQECHPNYHIRCYTNQCMDLYVEYQKCSIIYITNCTTHRDIAKDQM